MTDRILKSLIVIVFVLALSSCGGNTEPAGGTWGGGEDSDGGADGGADTSEEQPSAENVDWENVLSPDDFGIYSVEFRRGVMFVGTVGHVYMSEDDGASWTEVGKGLPSGEEIYYIRFVGEDVYVSIDVDLGDGVRHFTLYHLASGNERWSAVDGLHQFSFALGDSLFITSEVYGLREFRDGSQVGDIVAGYYGRMLSNTNLGDVFYGYNQFQKTISSIDLQTDEVETLVTLPDDESDYVSSIIDFDGSLYVNITSAGVFAYDLNSDFTNRAGIPVRDSTDTIDIEVTPSRFFISGSDLYRSGGGSGGGAIYKLTDGKFIARNYTEQGYLNPLAFDDDIVCGITNIYTLYCGTMN